MTQDAPELTVVIPAYNEEGRLLPTLERIWEWMTAAARRFEVIIVDDGSEDGTVAVARGFANGRDRVEVVASRENRGKGAAVREGFARSRGELVLFTDADLSTPIEEIAPMLREIEEGADFVLASRGLPDSRLEIRQAWYRERMGKTFNVLVRLWTGIPFRDTQCGFKLIRGEFARAIAGEMIENGFSFDVELILLAGRRGMVVRELPVTWRNDERSRVDPLTDSWRMLRALPGILHRTGRYGSRKRRGKDTEHAT
jgi:dolichyl-phosphate beta-glucosyltransferase